MKVLNLILFVSIIVFNSCSEKSDKELVLPQAGENFNFYESASLYEEAQKSRSKSYSDAFEIEKVERIDNLLNITVSYLGNCETNKFDIIWDGILLESWPMQANLIIKRDASNCDNEMKKETLSIDLVELIGDQVLVEGTVFYVSNASKTRNEENADETVTT